MRSIVSHFFKISVICKLASFTSKHVHWRLEFRPIIALKTLVLKKYQNHNCFHYHNWFISTDGHKSKTKHTNTRRANNEWKIWNFVHVMKNLEISRNNWIWILQIRAFRTIVTPFLRKSFLSHSLKSAIKIGPKVSFFCLRPRFKCA